MADRCPVANVRFGSLAAIYRNSSLAAAFGGKADVKFTANR